MTFIASLGMVTPASADPGDADPTFGDGGVVTISSPSQRLNYVERQGIDDAADLGVWLTVDLTDSEESGHQARLIRLREDGSHDQRFSVDGMRRLPTYPTDRPRSLDAGAVQVSGIVENTKGRTFGFLGRYRADGTPQSEFGTNGHVRTRLRGLGSLLAEVMLDGGTVQCATVEGGEVQIDRTDDAGVPVAGFGTGGTAVVPNLVHGWVADCQPSDSGGVLVAIQASTRTQLVRLTVDGQLDESYGDGGTLVLDEFSQAEWCSNVWMLPDGRAMIGCSKDIGATTAVLLARVRTDGSLDPTFGADGFIEVRDVGGDFVSYGDLELAANNSFWVSGLNYRGGWDLGGLFLLRRAANGAPVEDYGDGGLVAFEGTNARMPTSVAVDAQRRALVATVSQAIPTSDIVDAELARLQS